MKQCPGLVMKTRERCLICPEVCSVENDGCCPFVELDLSGSESVSEQLHLDYSKTLTVKCVWYLSVACGQTGRSGTVDAFGVTRKMWE